MARAGHLAQVDVKRVERKRGNSRIRIGICASMRRRRIVNWQDLDDLEASSPTPVHQALDIRKFPHAKTLARAQTKNRNRYPGAFPSRGRQSGKSVINDDP